MVPGDGATWISRVHVDDLVSTIIAVGDATRLRRRTYCVADDDPCQSRVLADAVARALGVAAPASVPFAAMSPLAQELAGSNRRVNGRALRDELGIAMRYPSWRDGVAADLGLRDRIR
jgi:nucleoside-diphosphate-sugar epimerase